MENATPNFLMEGEKIEKKNVLAELTGLVETYRSLQTDIGLLEAQLKDANDKFNKVSQEEIPNLLDQYQLSEIKLQDGSKVIVKEDVSVTITNDAEFFNYLKKKNEDDIIKLVYNFSNKMADDDRQKLADFLVENEYDFEVERSVHAQTKKKYFKETLGVGMADFEQGIKDGKYLKVSDLPDWAKVYMLKRTYIK